MHLGRSIERNIEPIGRSFGWWSRNFRAGIGLTDGALTAACGFEVALTTFAESA